MAIAPTIAFFGQNPSTIELQSSTDFNGTAHTGVPVITPGKYTFPPQAGGGLFNFHDYPIDIKNITYRGGGTLTITKTIAGGDAVIATISTQGEYFENTTISPGDYLKFTTSGATNPSIAITSQLTSFMWGG